MVKKILTAATALCLSAAVVHAAEMKTEDSDRTLYINNIYTNVDVLKIDGIEVIPLKELCDRLGYVVMEKENCTVEIAKGENCKNKLGMTVKAELVIGGNVIKTVDTEGNLNEIDMMTETVVQYNNELYLPAFYIGRILDLKLQSTADHKIGILTRDHIADITNDAEEARGSVVVRYFDGDEAPRIEIDGETVEFDAMPFIDANGRTQVPVREFCEHMNMSVMWFEDPNRVAISSVPPETKTAAAGGESYWFVIGENRCRKNGTYYDIDTAAQLIDGKTYIPLKYLAEMIDYNIIFNPSSNSVSEIGEGYMTMLSYLGLDRGTVLRELGFEDRGEDYFVKETDADIGRRTVGIGLSDEGLTSFFYLYSDPIQAKELLQDIEDYLYELYGESYVPEGELGTDEIPDDPNAYQQYISAWNMDGENGKQELALRFGYAPEGNYIYDGYYVFVSLEG